MKAKNKQHVCRYTHCYYGNTEIPPDDEIKVGNRYMHKKCAIASQSIQKAKELYYENISSTVVMSQLLNVINNIIFTAITTGFKAEERPGVFLPFLFLGRRS